MEAEVNLLRAHGHAVEVFLRHNDSIDVLPMAKVAARTFWSAPSARQIEAVLETFCPDIVHVHNTFPLISPSIYWVAHRLRIPVVQTLHNFRLLCPQATFLRDGKVCEDCLGKLPWRGVARACYRGSRPQTAVLAGMITVHRALGTWRGKVTRYIALNEFCRTKFIAGGLPPERIVVKPNFGDFAPPQEQARSGLLYVGRLSHEKGIDTLARASALVQGTAVRVAGAGPEERALEGVGNIRRLGLLTGLQVREEMSRARALVLPSLANESFPMALVEAFGCGLPVIASRAGALGELVEDGVTGLLFEAGDIAALADKMRWVHDHPQELAAMGANARARYEARYTSEMNYRQLVDIYRDAADEVRAQRQDH